MINEKNKEQYHASFEELGIPLIYDSFPKEFDVHINGWSFADDEKLPFIDVELTDIEIKELKEKGLISKITHLEGKTYRVKRIRTLDIEIAADHVIDSMNKLKDRFDAGEFLNKNGKTDALKIKREFASLYQDSCTQRCPHCFNQEDDFYVNKILSGTKLMKWEDTFSLIKQAKKIGLSSIKFLGIGEIFKIPSLFSILDDLKKENIIIAIFTKGSALGNDEIAKNCGYEGVSSAEDLVKKLAPYKNVSILLGGNSFNPKMQDEMVGCGKDGGVDNYTEKRNQALKLLVKHGFNDPRDGKRLALVAAPTTPKVSDEIVEMYEWGMKRNIVVISIPTMVSGKGPDELEWLFQQFENEIELIQRYDPSRVLSREERYVEWLVDFYTDMNLKAISMGITDLHKIKSEGLSGYAAAAKCQQTQNGMYLRLPETAQECPGRCVGAEIADNIKSQSLLLTWVASKNYDRSKNCKAMCAVKMKDLTQSKINPCECCIVYDNVGSIPVELEPRVFDRLLYHIASSTHLTRPLNNPSLKISC